MEQTSLLSINPGLIFWTIVTFVILVFLLKKFVWGPVLDAVDRRERSLRELFEGAEKSKSEAQKLLERYEGQLSKAREDVKNIIEEGRQKARSSAEEMITKARNEADQVLEHSKAEIVREREKAIAEIKGKVVEISLLAAERVIKQTLKEADHRKLIEETIGEIGDRLQ